jgi:hypothetical protein
MEIAIQVILAGAVLVYVLRKWRANPLTAGSRRMLYGFAVLMAVAWLMSVVFFAIYP